MGKRESTSLEQAIADLIESLEKTESEEDIGREKGTTSQEHNHDPNTRIGEAVCFSKSASSAENDTIKIIDDLIQNGEALKESTNEDNHNDYTCGKTFTIHKETKDEILGLELGRLRKYGGIHVIHIEKTSKFSSAGLKPGMQILSINERPCPNNFQQVAMLMKEAAGDLKISAIDHKVKKSWANTIKEKRKSSNKFKSIVTFSGNAESKTVERKVISDTSTPKGGSLHIPSSTTTEKRSLVQHLGKLFVRRTNTTRLSSNNKEAGTEDTADDCSASTEKPAFSYTSTAQTACSCASQSDHMIVHYLPPTEIMVDRDFHQQVFLTHPEQRAACALARMSDEKAQEYFESKGMGVF